MFWKVMVTFLSLGLSPPEDALLLSVPESDLAPLPHAAKLSVSAPAIRMESVFLNGFCTIL
ncbi:hypothetical protein D3C80_2141180 [compost metagenome]